MRAVNPNAQPEVQRVLDYLEENRGNRLILGQHTQTMEQTELEHIRRITGKLPALCGFELLGYSPNIRPEDSGEECMTEVVNARGTLRKAWEWARLGGLITFTWHWFSPLGGRDKSFYSENTDFSASRAPLPWYRSRGRVKRAIVVTSKVLILSQKQGTHTPADSTTLIV